MKFCRHCQRSKVNRPRGLCWSCYYAPGIRDRYVTKSKFLNRGYGNGQLANVPLPTTPTRAVPGSEEKIQVLTERAKNTQALFHPDDLTVARPGLWGSH